MYSNQDNTDCRHSNELSQDIVLHHQRCNVEGLAVAVWENGGVVEGCGVAVVDYGVAVVGPDCGVAVVGPEWEEWEEWDHCGVAVVGPDHCGGVLMGPDHGDGGGGAV